MYAERSSLLVFRIPESLDYMSLLRPPGPDDVGRLDASEAEDPEEWSPEEVDSAIAAVVAVVSGAPQDAIDILSREPFHKAFNLMRHFQKLTKDQQMQVCQSFSMLCKKNYDILQKVPPSPYFNRRDSADNTLYTNLEYKIISCSSALYSARRSSLEALAVSPSDMGLVLRSMCHVTTFLVCMTLKCATAPPKEEEKPGLSLELHRDKKAKTTKAMGKKRMQDEGSINHVALELLIDSILLTAKMPLSVPFSGAYGGNGFPDQPVLRLLMETLMLSLSTRIASFVSAKLVEAISLMIRINFDIMQAQMELHKEQRVNMRSDGEANENMESDHVEPADEEPESTPKEDEGQTNTEWLSLLADEVKKSNCVLIADAMEVLRDTAIPEVIMTEILLSIRENSVLQAHGGSGQLMSAVVQAEYSNVGVFIERVTRRLPRTVLSSLNELKQLFDVPSYNLRKSLLESIKSLIIMAKNEEGSSEYEEGDVTPANKANSDYISSAAKACARNREILLQLLLNRQLDTYMYARATLLKAFQDIIEAEALPIRWYVTTATVALSRLMDKGSQVRHRALNLLTVMIMDATTRRFQLPMNLDDLKRDLGIINEQLAKVDEIAAINITLMDTNGPTSERRNSVTEGLDQPGRTEEKEPATDEKIGDPAIRKAVLIKELNSELGENITMDDEDALNSVRMKLDFAKEMYSDVYEIAEMVDKSIAVARNMLRSSVETDQRAAIKYIAKCHLMGVDSASLLLPQVWVLSWSNNQNVVDAVLNEFKSVYFENGDDNTIAMRLIKLLAKSRLTEFASIEKIFEVNLAMEQPLFSNLDKVMVALLRIAVAPNYQVARDFVPRVALGVMRLILWSSTRSKCPQALAIQTFDEKKISAIKGLLQLSIEKSSTIFSELCLILTKAAPCALLQETGVYVLNLFSGTIGSMDDGWFKMAQCVVDVSFIHCKVPENIWSQLLANMLKNLTSDTKQKTKLRTLAQIIFLAGHVAIRTIITLDRLQSELKGARAELESFEGNKGENNASSQMGMATSDEQEREIFEQIAEQRIVCSNLLGSPLKNLIVDALHDPMRFISDSNGEGTGEGTALREMTPSDVVAANDTQREVMILKTCAAIAICKYATVSKQFCQSLFLEGKSNCSVLEVIISLLLNKRLDPALELGSLPQDKHCYYYLREPIGTTLRSSLLICYGDLLCRHPNLLDPWNKEVCMIVLDSDDKIRETAVLVFTHLVMNDMVKPKGKLIDGMMYLTLDSNLKIAEGAKTFFHEIHKKNPNTIYNCFPEMVATVARNKRRQSMARNLAIVNMLLRYIRKDKHAESIIEKMCLRLQATELSNKMAIAVYTTVLLKLNYDEKGMKKLVSSLPLMSHLIVDSDVMLAALLLISKRVKSSYLYKRGAEGDKGNELGENGDETGSTELANPGALSENASLKELAEELMQKLNALFGENKSSKVTQIGSSAESIIASMETSSEEELNYTETLFIHNFGYVSGDPDQAQSDDEADVYSQLETQASLSCPPRIKPEPIEGPHQGASQNVLTISAESTPNQSPHVVKKLEVPSNAKSMVSKPATIRFNEFDSSDEE